MEKLCLKIYDFLSTRKPLAWLLVALCFALAAAGALQLSFGEDIADFLPDDPVSHKYRAVYGIAGNQSRVAVVFEAPDSLMEAELCTAMTDFGKIWQQKDSDGVYNVKIRTNEKAVRQTISFIQNNIPYFLNAEDIARADSLLRIDGYAEQRMAQLKQDLRKPSAAFSAEYLRRDPLGLFSPVSARLQGLAFGGNFKSVDGYLLDKSGRCGFVFVDTPHGASDSGNNHNFAALCDSCSAQVMELHDGISVTAVGTPVISVTNANRIKQDGITAICISGVIILLLLVVRLRRLDYILWTAAATAFGFLFALSLMWIVKGGISVIILGICSVVAGIAVNYPLHYLDHLAHASDKRSAIKDVAKPLIIGNITTVAAFLCLVAVKAPAMQDFGIFASAALAGTILFVLLFLPALCSFKPRHEARKSERFKIRMPKMPGVLSRNKGIAFAAVCVITIALACTNGESFDSDMNHINYMTAEQRRALSTLAALRQENPGEAQMYAVAQGNNIQEALRNNEKLLGIISQNDSALKRLSGIGGFVSSRREQAEKIAAWNAFKNRHRTLENDLREACESAGLDYRLFTPFLNLFDKEFTVHDVDFFEPVNALTEHAYIIQDGSTYMIVNNLRADVGAAEELKTVLRSQIGDSGFVFDTKDTGSRLADELADELDYIGYVCAAVVFIFLWMSFGRIEISLLSFLPLAVSWIWITGIMHLADIRFNIVNIILATFIFGQGDDYTIFITEGCIRRYACGSKAIKSYMGSIALSAAIMFAGLGVLLTARHPAMFSLGQVATLGMAVVVFMAFYLPPAVYSWLTSKNGKPRQVPITLSRILFSIVSLTVFAVIAVVVMKPYTFVKFTLGKSTEKKRLRLHEIMYNFFHRVINKIPGVQFEADLGKEKFEKPALIICNHQSHLDLMCLLTLTPKMVILTNDWVWKNPLYRHLIRNAEFYPVSNGIEANEEKLADLARRGYSIVVFPEGTRSVDCSIGRFHQGAFYLARKLNLDILPVMLHGAGHVLPKTDFMLRGGKITMKVYDRVSPESLSGMEDRQTAKHFRHWYIEEFEKLSRQIETPQYFVPLIYYSYLYKGREVEIACKRALDYIKATELPLCKADKVLIQDSGYGAAAIAYALGNPDKQVYGLEADDEMRLIADNCQAKPGNLHFVKSRNEAPSDCDIVSLNLQQAKNQAQYEN